MTFHHPYPDQKIVSDITDALLDLLFPDVRGRSVRNEKDIEKALDEQVRTALQHNGMKTDETPIVAELFDALPSLRKTISEDMRAAYEGDPAARGPDEVILTYPTYVAVGTYRLAHVLQMLELPFIPRMMTEHAHRITGIDIHPGATIGHSFFIDHGTGVVIGETTEIGARVRLYQGVTLGAYNFPKDVQGRLIRGQKRHPTIEDDVTIYANATILGGGTVIGARSIVGSNVWLTESIPADSIVTMEEPQLNIRAKRKKP